MRAFFVFCGLIAIVSAVYLMGGNEITREEVERIYAESHAAALAFDDEAVCAVLADGYEHRLTVHVESQRQLISLDKQGYCDAQRSTFDALRRLGPQLRANRLVDATYTIGDVSISEDGHTATVQVRGTNVMPGIRTTYRTTDTIERRAWKTRVLRTEGVAWAGPPELGQRL